MIQVRLWLTLGYDERNLVWRAPMTRAWPATGAVSSTRLCEGR
jgi:hypothetical protein